MRRSLLVVGTLFLILLSGGCGLLDSGNEVRIELPVQEFDFELDASIIRVQLQSALNAYLADKGLPSVDISNLDELPAEVGGVPLNYQETFELETDPEQVDLSDEEDLKSYIEGGKIKSVKIKFIRADIATNTLNFATPEIEMYMDELNATGITASSSKIAVIPSIPAQDTSTVDLQFTPDGRDIMSTYLLGYKFAMMALIAITIDTNVTRTIPDGVLKGKLLISLEFTADPF